MDLTTRHRTEIMFTSHQYETAIAVLKEHSCSELSEGFIHFRDQAKRREDAAAVIASLIDPRHSATSNGARIMEVLLKSGWTPPEGLL